MFEVLVKGEKAHHLLISKALLLPIILQLCALQCHSSVLSKARKN